MRYIDMHCDTLGVAMTRHKNTITELESSMVDIERLQKVGAGAQFFAMFVPQRDVPAWFEEDKMPEHEIILGKSKRKCHHSNKKRRRCRIRFISLF